MRSNCFTLLVPVQDWILLWERWVQVFEWWERGVGAKEAKSWGPAAVCDRPEARSKEPAGRRRYENRNFAIWRFVGGTDTVTCQITLDIAADAKEAKSKEPAPRKGLGMNPYGIHGTDPALPFAKRLWVNSDGIHEKPKALLSGGGRLTRRTRIATYLAGDESNCDLMSERKADARIERRTVRKMRDGY
jgi:hypothetical protein